MFILHLFYLVASQTAHLNAAVLARSLLQKRLLISLSATWLNKGYIKYWWKTQSTYFLQASAIKEAHLNLPTFADRSRRHRFFHCFFIVLRVRVPMCIWVWSECVWVQEHHDTFPCLCGRTCSPGCSCLLWASIWLSSSPLMSSSKAPSQLS